MNGKGWVWGLAVISVITAAAFLSRFASRRGWRKRTSCCASKRFKDLRDWDEKILRLPTSVARTTTSACSSIIFIPLSSTACQAINTCPFVSNVHFLTNGNVDFLSSRDLVTVDSSASVPLSQSRYPFEKQSSKSPLQNLQVGGVDVDENSCFSHLFST